MAHSELEVRIAANQLKEVVPSICTWESSVRMMVRLIETAAKASHGEVRTVVLTPCL